MLPRVKIIYENGLLGASSPMDDGVVGLVISGEAVADKLVLSEPFLITKLDKLKDYGITSESDDKNALVYKEVKEFYDEAPEGTKLYIMVVADTVSLPDMVDKTKNNAKKLIEYAKGTINVLVLKNSSSATPTILDGLDSDVYSAMTNAQALCEWATETKFAPVFCLIEGKNYSGTAASLKDISESSCDRVAVVIGDTAESSKGACVGLLAGRIAYIPVQRSIARVKSGPIVTNTMYIKDKSVEDGDVDVIHDKGFIVPRIFVGKAGWFWSDDKLATAPTSDYALIPRRRTIDKAYRVAYMTVVEEIGDEIPVANGGGLPYPYAKMLENKIEQAIINTMGIYGNLGRDTSDDKDKGVKCSIDINQNVVATSLFEIQLRIKPYGYAKYIDVYLGFSTSTNQ